MGRPHNWTEDGDAYTTDTDQGGSAPGGPATWPAGNYTGKLLRHELVTSQIKGTPGIRLWFEVEGEEVTADVWITDASADIAIQQLESIGWNGDFAAPEFAGGDATKLYLKHETYKNKPQARWSISTFATKPPPAPTDGHLAQFAARYKAKTAAPPPAPSGKPTAPTTPPVAPAPKPAPKPPPAAQTPPAKPAGKASKQTAYDKAVAAAIDLDSAWAAWQAVECSDADAFYREVKRVTGAADGAGATPDQWREVAAAAPPF